MSNYFKYSHPRGIINALIFRITRRLEEATLEEATRIAMITKTMMNMVDARHHHKITLISDGADTEMFHPRVDPSRIKDEYGIDNEPVIGYQGGIEPFDGLQFLAEAAPYVVKEVPNVRFLIAGQGTYLNKVKDIIKKNGTSDRFIFIGWIDYKRVPEVLRATTVSVVPIPDCPAMRPLLTFRLLEAMASGTPVVINDLPGAKELVNEEMSFFTRVEDPQKFAGTLTQAIRTDKRRLREMAEAARKRIEPLDWRRIGCLDADFVEGERL
jgi:glycosyltransferase involved in cell wall biosynthesis